MQVHRRLVKPIIKADVHAPIFCFPNVVRWRNWKTLEKKNHCAGSNPVLTTDTHGNLELMHHEQVMRANMENTSQCVGKYQVLLTVGNRPTL